MGEAKVFIYQYYPMVETAFNKNKTPPRILGSAFLTYGTPERNRTSAPGSGVRVNNSCDVLNYPSTSHLISFYIYLSHLLSCHILLFLNLTAVKLRSKYISLAPNIPSILLIVCGQIFFINNNILTINSVLIHSQNTTCTQK